MDRGSENITAKKAIMMAISTRSEEVVLQEEYIKEGYKCAAVNIGGKMPDLTSKIIESTIVAAIRHGVIEENKHNNGVIAGAVREALGQIQGNMHGLSVGGKIGIARSDQELSVALFFSVGMLNLNETLMAVSHRVI